MEQEFDALSVGKLVFTLGIPAMLAQFFNILYSITDRIFVGHIPGQGEIALASIGICAPLLTAVTAFSTLVGIGGASVMSIAVGQKDHKSAEKGCCRCIFTSAAPFPLSDHVAGHKAADVRALQKRRLLPCISFTYQMASKEKL